MSDPTTSPSLDEATAEVVRVRREQLRVAEERLTSAAGAPSPGRLDLWWPGVHHAIGRLTDAFAHHVEGTEGPDGLLEEISSAAPHLSNEVDHLRADHRQIADALAALARRTAPRTDDEVDSVRSATLEILSALARHRFAGSDLLWRAYQVDIGGVD